MLSAYVIWIPAIPEPDKYALLLVYFAPDNVLPAKWFQ